MPYDSSYVIPTTTPVPDDVFDLLMPQLTGAELKVLLYLCRRTFGFQQDAANISLGHLMRGTGLSRESVTLAVHDLEAHGVIVSSQEQGSEPTTYALNFLA